ncbi:5611_t:CDS:2 [Diversispora eburnea]|uniref:5611_t:CDS:1 n=1 Tax=Diversispora eburnea TaxID=1213867 RepID=A0A9N8YV05_9GLOM|nr:5611_t:CDS:2 [Diversispora eburnea]
MNNFISSVPSIKPSFSAPVRGPSKDTPVVSVSPNDVSKASNISRSNNYSNNYSFNSSKLREPNSFNGINTCESFDSKKQRSGDRRLRRHAYSDSVDEDKFRNVAPITILKRPQSATDFVKKPTSERRRSDVTSSKVNRVQQRREVKSTNELLSVDTDVSQGVNSTTTTTTPNKLQPDSSIDESDVNIIFNSNLKSVYDSPSKNSTGLLVTPPSPLNNNSFVFPLLNYSNAIIALEEEMSNQNDKRSFDVIIPPKTMSRRTSSSAVELQKSSPKLYAGPTFHNSPPASDLPIPSFLSKSSSTRESSPVSSNSTSVPSRVSSPSLSSENSSDEDISMDESEPYLKRQNSQLLNMLSSHPNNSHNSAAAYMVPERMATSHNPMQVYPAPNGMLNELSECLRKLVVYLEEGIYLLFLIRYLANQN